MRSWHDLLTGVYSRLLSVALRCDILGLYWQNNKLPLQALTFEALVTNERHTFSHIVDEADSILMCERSSSGCWTASTTAGSKKGDTNDSGHPHVFSLLLVGCTSSILITKIILFSLTVSSMAARPRVTIIPMVSKFASVRLKRASIADRHRRVRRRAADSFTAVGFTSPQRGML